MMEKLSAKEFDENYKVILEQLNNAALSSGRNVDDIILLAATKTVDPDTINYAINSGIKYIGENKVQEFLQKNDEIINVHKHFIGHLQSNKVKDIIDKVELIQSVHSIKLAKEVSKQAAKHNKVMSVLLEVNIGNEESKSGFSAEEIYEAVHEISELDNIFIKGLMAIPPICDTPESNRKYFAEMNKIFVDIRSKKIDNSSMDILSMGMSDDFSVAITEGANSVRLGTALFGKRIYK